MISVLGSREHSPVGSGHAMTAIQVGVSTGLTAPSEQTGGQNISARAAFPLTMTRPHLIGYTVLEFKARHSWSEWSKWH